MKVVFIFALVCAVGSWTLHQRDIEEAKNLGDGEEIWEGDMILTKNQVEELYGKASDNSDQDQDRSDEFGAGFQLREGDMLLSKRQIQALYGEVQERQSLTDGRILWTNGIIPYMIDPSAYEAEHNIESAIKTWEHLTCIKFPKYDGGPKNPVVFMTDINEAGRCASDVGMEETVTRVHILHLGGTTCYGVGSIIHEIGHSIGFLHEQSREDRDKYVRIVEKNINKTLMNANFPIYKSLHAFDNISYDFGSLMHYDIADLTINGNNTVIPYNPEHILEMGERHNLSFSDVKLANLMYNCSENCTIKPLCQNEGFVDKNCECQCPKEYRGTYCEHNVPSTACRFEIEQPEDIQTPNYPKSPPLGTKCLWEFKAPTGKTVQVFFDNFNLFPRRADEKSCYWDQVHVRGGGFNGENAYCADELNRRTLYIGPHENGTFLIYKFKAPPDSGDKWGFHATVTFL